MAQTPLGANIFPWPTARNLAHAVIILSFASLLAGQALPCPDPSTPLPPPPDPTSKPELVCRYVYISYPDAGEEYLGEDLIFEVPTELQRFMNDQANGVFTFDIQTLYVPQDSLKTWMSGRTTVDYLTPGAPMPFHDAGACESGDVVAAEAHAEILTQILATYDQFELPNPFANCDYIFFIHPVRMCDGHKGSSSTVLKLEPYWVGLLSSVQGFHTDRSPTSYNLDIKQNLLELSAHEFGHNMGLFHPTEDKQSDHRPSFGAYDMMRPLVLYTSTAGG